MSKLLSDNEVSAYRERGYHFPVDALSASEVTGFRQKLEDYEAASGGPIKGEVAMHGHLGDGRPCHQALRLAAGEVAASGDPLDQMAAAAFLAIGAS